GWFQWYLRGYLPKHFHSLSVAVDTRPTIEPHERLVVYLNHAAWWDPLISLHLAAKLFPHRKVIAPFEAEAIKQYPLFERLGFFGVDKSSRRGAAEFLRTAAAAVSLPDTSLWITPEGRFADPRDRTAAFEPGLAHLAHKMASTQTDGGRPAVFVPLAIEYPFWEERLPEALARFGEPVRVGDFPDYDKDRWAALLEARLRESQDALQRLSLERRESAFEVLLGGRAGVGGVYESIRRAVLRVTGKQYQASHGEKLQT
ncbi:MAG: lysophospholipid acyltransferase family protein, partial [Planctomycetota bacterium]